MAVTSTVNPGAELVRHANGSLLDDAGGSNTIALGFAPRYVEVINETDRIRFEWFEGMTATNFIQTVAAGTVTLATTNLLSVSGRNFSFTAVQNKQYRWRAFR